MQKAIKELLQMNINTADDLTAAKRKIAKKYKIGILENSEIIREYRRLVAIGAIHELPLQERLLRKRAVRTMSGIAPVAVLTKPYPCPGECVYCPTEPDVPQSYLSNEPAVMRAIRCNYHPYTQVQDRIRALVANGHEPTKIELIVIGGTWSVLPTKYKYWFIANCFAGANQFEIKNQKSKIKIDKNLNKLKEILKVEKNKNEKAKYRIVGITLETRPDYINEKELLEMRELGCTRVELGVQAVDDKILKLNKRGHGVDAITNATRLLKDYGFKVTYHIMPGLPGATAAKDLKMFKALFTPLDKLNTIIIDYNNKNKDKKINEFISKNYQTGFTDERFQPDQIKFYPTVVTRGSLLYRWYKAGKYKSYSARTLEKLIADCKRVVPPYVRIIRLIRDIPGESIIAGNTVTNLRQVMQARGVKCSCIRCREVRSTKSEVRSQKFGMIKYRASGGEEYFLQYTDKTGKVLYGFCRLRLPSVDETHANETRHGASLRGAALVRELHVYGELVSVGNPSTGSGQERKVQHAGLGKKLLKEAEKIARERGYKRMAVISGVGVRDYYRKLGYRLNNTYMVKGL